MRQRNSTLEQMTRLAVELQPVRQLTDEQWHRVHKSVLRQLDTDESFRSDAAVDIADTFTLEDYEMWFNEVVG